MERLSQKKTIVYYILSVKKAYIFAEKIKCREYDAVMKYEIVYYLQFQGFLGKMRNDSSNAAVFLLCLAGLLKGCHEAKHIALIKFEVILKNSLEIMTNVISGKLFEFPISQTSSWIPTKLRSEIKV